MATLCISTKTIRQINRRSNLVFGRIILRTTSRLSLSLLHRLGSRDIRFAMCSNLWISPLLSPKEQSSRTQTFTHRTQTFLPTVLLGQCFISSPIRFPHRVETLKRYVLHVHAHTHTHAHAHLSYIVCLILGFVSVTLRLALLLLPLLLRACIYGFRFVFYRFSPISTKI